MRSAFITILLYVAAFSHCAPAFAEDSPPITQHGEANKPDDRVATVQIEDYSKRVESRFALFTHHRTFLIPYSYVTNPTESIYEPFKKLNDSTHDFYQKNKSEF